MGLVRALVVWLGLVAAGELVDAGALGGGATFEFVEDLVAPPHPASAVAAIRRSRLLIRWSFVMRVSAHTTCTPPMSQPDRAAGRAGS